MSLHSLAGCLQGIGLSVLIRGSEYAYRVIGALHMVAFAAFGGMVLMTNLRLPGWMAGASPVSDVVNRLRVPKCIAFIIFFWTELSLLLLIALNGLLFRQTVDTQADERDAARRMPWRAKLAATLSLILWFGVVCAGRGIAHTVYRPG